MGLKNYCRIIFNIVFFQLAFYLPAQNIDIEISDKPYPLIKDEQNRIAISAPFGVYDAGIGLNLENHPNANSFQQSEFLVLAYFKMLKNADMGRMVDLYDEESKGLILQRLDINAANSAYKNFNDFELISKNVFGTFSRIRFNFTNTANNDFFPWVLMIKKIGNRYYLTETIPLEHLFISVSSAHPNNLTTEAFESPSVAGMQAFSFIQDGNGIKRVNAIVDKTNTITIYLRLEKYNSEEIKRNPTEEIILLEDMKKTLVENDSSGFINLWAPEEKAEMTSDIFRTDIESNRAFYKKISALKPVGFLKAGDEIVLFYRSKFQDSYLPLQMMAIKKIGTKYKLRASLDSERLETYYAWEILNNESVKNAIENYFDERN